MANEITVTQSASLNNGSLNSKFSPGSKKFDQGTAGVNADTASLTTSSTQLDKGSLSTSSGWAFLTNLSTANDALWGLSTGFGFRLSPEASNTIQLDSTSNIHAATTNGVTGSLFYLMWST